MQAGGCGCKVKAFEKQESRADLQTVSVGGAQKKLSGSDEENISFLIVNRVELLTLHREKLFPVTECLLPEVSFVGVNRYCVNSRI